VSHDSLVTTAAPPYDDPVVADVGGLVGGPRGGHSTGRPSRWWMPVRVLLLLTVLTSLLGFLQKAPCRTNAWSNDYQYTRVCYTDVFALYYSEHLDGNQQTGSRLGVPYRDEPVEYPAVIGGLMWAAAEVTDVIHPNDPHNSASGVVDGRGQTFFDVTVFGLAICALIVTWCVGRLAGRTRVWDAAMVALAPILIFDGFINWDLVAVALTCLGMFAWSRNKPVVAGALFGVGVATKLYPLLALLGLLFLCLRARRMRPWFLAAAASVGGFCLAYLPAWLLSRSFPFPSADCPGAHPLTAWRFFWSLSTVRGADWGSPWLVLQDLRGGRALDSAACGQAPVVLNIAAALAMLVVVGMVFFLVMMARRRPRVAQVAFLLVAGFILVNKVDSPQYCLWLLPLAVLARPQWRVILLWQVSEVLLGVANFYSLVNLDKSVTGIPQWVYLAAYFLRDATLLWLVALVVRDALRPQHDVVRRGGVDDPAGGVLAGSPDRWAGHSGSAVPATA
jgi:uncharacterized membrane protein